MKYHLFTFMKNDSLHTLMVSDEELKKAQSEGIPVNMEQYFIGYDTITTNWSDHGTVTIHGEAVHIIPDIMIDDQY